MKAAAAGASTNLRELEEIDPITGDKPLFVAAHIIP